MVTVGGGPIMGGPIGDEPEKRISGEINLALSSMDIQFQAEAFRPTIFGDLIIPSDRQREALSGSLRDLLDHIESMSAVDSETSDDRSKNKLRVPFSKDEIDVLHAETRAAQILAEAKLWSTATVNLLRSFREKVLVVADRLNALGGEYSGLLLVIQACLSALAVAFSAR